MLGALLANIRLVTGTATAAQDPATTSATGRLRMLGTASTQQSPGETSASAAGADVGEAVTTQSSQVTAAAGTVRITGTAATQQQGRQRVRAAGLGPARQTPRYLRVPREETGAGRTVTIR